MEDEKIYKVIQAIDTLRLISDGAEHGECDGRMIANAIRFVAESLSEITEQSRA